LAHADTDTFIDTDTYV